MPDETETYGRIPGKTVYVLGSGFSAPIGIPTIGRFMDDGRRRLKEEALRASDPDLRKFISQIGEVLQRCHGAATTHSGGKPTIEDYFCVIDGDGAEEDREQLCRFMCHVCDIEIRRHRDTLRNNWICAPLVPAHLGWGEPDPALSIPHYPDRGQTMASAYDVFLAQVFAEAEAQPDADARPAIITLNYDRLLEETHEQLWKGRGWKDRRALVFPGFDHPQRSAGVCVDVCKIHGSVRVSRRGPKPVAPSWRRCGFSSEPWQTIAGAAKRHLRLADRIVIIGFSMAAIDADIRSLFLAALATPDPPKVTVYSKLDATEARRRVTAYLGANIEVVDPAAPWDLFAFLDTHRPPHRKRV